MKKDSKMLVIAGFDPSGGAGVVADLETLNNLGARATAAITAITIQNSNKFEGFMSLPADNLRKQIIAIFDQFKIKGVKIGMIGNSENAEVIAEMICNYRPPQIVVDPIHTSSTGVVINDEATFELMKEKIFPCTDVITPNREEAEYLLGGDSSNLSPTSLAVRLAEKYKLKALVITGAEAKGGSFDLVYDGENANLIQSQKVKAKDFHGTGCRHSTALCYYLSKGIFLNESALLAKDYVLDYLNRI